MDGKKLGQAEQTRRRGLTRALAVGLPQAEQATRAIDATFSRADQRVITRRNRHRITMHEALRCIVVEMNRGQRLQQGVGGKQQAGALHFGKLDELIETDCVGNLQGAHRHSPQRRQMGTTAEHLAEVFGQRVRMYVPLLQATRRRQRSPEKSSNVSSCIVTALASRATSMPCRASLVKRFAVALER